MSGSSVSSDEISFMAEYAWTTLIALYERFRLDKRLRLRNIDSDIVIGGNAAAALKLLHVLNELSTVVREILRRISAIVVEELEVSGSARGRVATKLTAKYLPAALPVYRTRLELETPANLLLAATLVELRAWLQVLIERLPLASPELALLRKLAVKNLQELFRRCEYFLYEPVLRPLLAKAQLVASNPRRLEELEREVELEALKKPRELRAYLRLLELRKLLKEDVQVLKREVEELGKTLSLSLRPGKLYELYGLALVLKALIEELKPSSADVASNEQELRLGSNSDIVSVFYNALPESLESKVAKARAVGLIDGEVDKELIAKLRGLPDTIIRVLRGGQKKTLLLDYKYSREYKYLSQARFKVLAYLYEFDADCGVVVAPRPSMGSEEDEETYDHKGFYDEIAKHCGASIFIDTNGKILAVVYADPCKEAVESSLKALRVIIRLCT